MKRILLGLLVGCHVLMAGAQKKAPKWMDKQRKAVVSLTVYDKENKRLATGTAFFISGTGEALSAYNLFKGAAKAVVKDIDGKEWEVTRILGADELYDVIRFQVAVPRKVTFFPLAAEPLTEGTTVYLLPYSTGKAPVFAEGPVTEVSKLKEAFCYYKMAIPLATGQENSPLLTGTGEVFGLAQADASGNKSNSYAVSAGYVHSLQITSTDAFNSTYASIGIPKAWPSDPAQAQVALLIKASQEETTAYLETLNDFIATFPEIPDGYVSRASHYAYHRKELAATPEEQAACLDRAFADLETAARYTEKKGDIGYNRAKLIYGVVTADTTLKVDGWNVDAALEAIGEALREEDSPVYRQLEGDMYFYQGKYQEAYDDYMRVNNSEMASPTSWYWAAQAKEQMPGMNFGEVIALLDSAIAECGTPPSPEAAPYLLERIEWKLKLMNYPAAIADYDLYFQALNGQVDDRFYYYREQARFRANDLEGALADIQKALQMSPADANYLAEEASIYIRMEKYDDALNSVAEALTQAPDFAACHRLRGVCYIRQKKQTEACEALRQAEALGDPVAGRLLKEHCK